PRAGENGNIVESGDDVFAIARVIRLYAARFLTVTYGGLGAPGLGLSSSPSGAARARCTSDALRMASRAFTRSVATSSAPCVDCSANRCPRAITCSPQSAAVRWLQT